MDEFEVDENESGSSLRQKLSEAHQKLRERDEKISVYEARDLISEKGFKFVKPEDLKGVASKELEKKALEIEERKSQERADVLREALADIGVPEDQLEARIASMLGDTQSEQRSGLAAISNAARLPGTPVQPLQLEGLSPVDKIRAGVEKRKK